MSCVELKPLRDRSVSESDIVQFTNYELLPLVKQMRRFIQDTLGTTWCVLPTDGADDGDIIVYSDADGPGWQSHSDVVSDLLASDDDPLPVDLLADPGIGTPYSRWDHVHPFDQSIIDVDDLLDEYSVIAGDGLTGGGTLDTNPTINVVAADDTITVNADSIQANITELESQLDQNLEEVLTVGNDASGLDILMSGGDIDFGYGEVIDAGAVEIDQVGNAAEVFLRLKSDAAQSILVQYQHGANRAWRDRIVPTTGDRQIAAYNTATDAAIDVPITLVRAAGGDIDFARTLDMNGNPIDNASNITIEGATPFLDYTETDRAANAQRWRVLSSAARYRLLAMSDDGLTQNPAFDVTRSTSTPTEFNLFVDLDMNVNDIVNVDDNFQFDITASPMIWQEPQTVSGTNGTAMIIAAQDGAAAGPSGSSGGSLYLRGGAPGFEAGSGGSVYLQPRDGSGTVDALVATRQSVELGVDINLNGFDIDTEDGSVEIGTGQITSDSGAVDFGDNITMGGNNIDLESGILDGMNFAVCEQLDADAPPSIGVGQRALGYFEDGDAGSPCLGVWNGNNWLRIPLGAAVSSS